jgi:hypothetical protein
MNKENLNKILDIIKADPSSWNQRRYHCGTAHCLAGHAELLAGYTHVKYVIKIVVGNEGALYFDSDELTTLRARRFLDLNRMEASFLFRSYRTFEDFESFRDGRLKLSRADVAYAEDNYRNRTIVKENGEVVIALVDPEGFDKSNVFIGYPLHDLGVRKRTPLTVNSAPPEFKEIVKIHS